MRLISLLSSSQAGNLLAGLPTCLLTHATIYHSRGARTLTWPLDWWGGVSGLPSECSQATYVTVSGAAGVACSVWTLSAAQRAAHKFLCPLPMSFPQHTPQMLLDSSTWKLYADITLDPVFADGYKPDYFQVGSSLLNARRAWLQGTRSIK